MSMRKQSAGGYSLAEVMIVLVITSSMMAATSLLILQMRLAHLAGQQGLQSSLALTELGGQFRRDVRGALAAQVHADGEAQQLEIERPEGTRILYQMTDDGLRREQVDPAGKSRRETYQMADITFQAFEVPETAGPIALRLARIDTISEHETTVRHVFRIQAWPQRGTAAQGEQP